MLANTLKPLQDLTRWTCRGANKTPLLYQYSVTLFSFLNVLQFVINVQFWKNNYEIATYSKEERGMKLNRRPVIIIPP